MKAKNPRLKARMNRRVYFLGDIHGQFQWLSNHIHSGKIQNAYIIQVGDFGVGFSTEEVETLKILNRACFDRNVEIFVIRGNHDDPSYFEGSFMIYSNITFLQDDSFLKLNNLTYFLSGGAISIDRTIRKINVSYWSNEGACIKFETLESSLTKYAKIDVVVTHTAPSFAFPTVYDPIVHAYLRRDPKLDTDLKVERAMITKLYHLLLPKGIQHWIYGHFHSHHEEVTYTKVKFVALDCN